MHALPGLDEEFYLTGTSRYEQAPDVKAQVRADAVFTPRGSDPLFEFDIEVCLWSRWVNVGQPGTYPERRIWKAGGG